MRYKSSVDLTSSLAVLSKSKAPVFCSDVLLLQLVIGPAVDGGYYLLGTTVAIKELFQVRQYAEGCMEQPREFTPDCISI